MHTLGDTRVLHNLSSIGKKIHALSFSKSSLPLSNVGTRKKSHIINFRSINLASQFTMEDEARNPHSAICPNSARPLHYAATIILRMVSYTNRPACVYVPLGKLGENDYSISTRRYPWGQTCVPGSGAPEPGEDETRPAFGDRNDTGGLAYAERRSSG